MELEELYSKSQEKYHRNCNCKKFCATCDDKYNYHHVCASQDLLFRINHAPRTPRRPKTITIFKNGKLRKYAYFKGFSTLMKKYILSNEISNSSLPNFRKAKNKYNLSSKSKSNEEITSKKLHPFRVNLIVNTVTGTEHFYYSANTFGKPCWKIYRCQFNTQEESCCCSCNSDAMFEVMKSLYDCYKKKNCDHCNCILCGHLPREERRLGEIRKSVPELKAISAIKSKKIKKIKGKKIKDVTSLLKDKSPEEKENILRDLVNAGAILPEGKTKSERELIQKVEAERMIPEEKKVSEKILEERIKSEALISKKRIPSEKLRKAKEEGLLTPLEGKTPKQKEKILKGLAMNGIPLPTAKTPSTKKIIDKVRKEMGLPPEPLTADDKQKYKNAMETGLITPLEGKSPSEKERILQGLAATGVPLPEARTPSEKALIAKIKEQIPTEIAIKPEKRKPISRALMEVKTLSDKLRKAKAEGLLTPLEGKTDEQKRKILKELVKNHIPLPEGKTASEKKIIDQVHEEMGLPPQPKTPSTKEKYQEAIKAGLVTPLEGKTASEKEKVLTDLAALGVELPVGRTSSEKALIAKVKEKVPVVGEILVRPERKLTKPGALPSLRGKTPEEKEQLLKNFAINNIPLPEGKSPSEKVLIDKIRADIGLPPEPKSKSEKGLYKQAQAAGLIVPLEGKTQSEKEKILQGQADLGLELPQGRTASEKSLINKIKKGKKKKVKTRDKGISPPALPPEKRKKLDTKTLKVMKESKGPSDECICGLLTPESERLAPESLPSIKIPSEKLKAAKAAGLLTPLEGKTPSQKEKILKNLAKTGIPLPEPKTASEKKILEKVQNDLGLPPTPLTPSLKEKYAKAQVAGIITPLEGKTPSQKEKILNKQAEMGLNLPVGRTPSEKALIDKIRTGVRTAEIPSEKFRKYSLEGKTPEEKEKNLKNLAKAGLPLPEGKTPSEKAIVKKVKEAAGLPIVSPPASERLRKAKAAGLLTPLEGKTPAQKEDLIKRHLAAGIPLPEPKTASEKKIIKDVIAKSSKLLHGKTLSQKEKILKNIAKQGLPLPEPKTASDKAIVDKIRAEATPSLKLRQAHAAGLMTPLQGKTNDEKEKILKGLVKAGIPLPEATSPSEKKVFEKVRYDLGLPPEPKSLSIKEKMHQAQVAGIITPLEGKTPAQKEKVLKKMHEAGIPLPKGKTKSEKSMIKKIKGEVVSEKLKEAKVKGLITPLEGKTPEQKEKILRKLAKSDMPLPEGKTPSEKALVAKIKAEEGIVPKLPPPELPEKIKKLDKKTAKIMKEGKGPSDECICGLLTPKPVGEILPVQKIPSEKMRKAKAAGLLTPLEGKSPEQKEKILKGLAMHEIPLPEPKTTSEKRLHDKVRADLGMTPQPKTPSAKIKYNDAVAAGLIAPLEGKSPSQKEKILKGQAALGIPLPEGRTPSEKALIAKVKAAVPVPVGEVLPIKKVPSEKVRKAKAAGLLTPLEGKSPEQKEKILKGLAMHEIPLPEPKTASEKRLHDKVRADLGMTPQPKTPSAKIKYNDAVAAGLIAPLEGKSPSQKEKILKGQAALGIPLPEGRSPSEKALIAKVKAAVPIPVGEVLPIKKVPSEKVRKAKAAGLLTPLEGKSPEQKEKILKGLAMHEIPLPEPKTASEKRLHDKVRADLGMTPQPKTPSAKIKYNDAVAAGLIAPLEGKSPSQKEKILKGQAALGIPLPEGRTPSEKALIAKVKAAVPVTVGEVLPIKKIPSEKMRKAKAAGLLTPLEGKSPEQKEKILKGLAMHEIPLPEPKTASEKRLHDKVRADLGMTPQPKTPSAKIKYNDAVAAGLIAPLEGKTPSQKEKILKGQAALGIPLPEGRTPSEKALIAKVKTAVPVPVSKVLPIKKIPSEKVRKAKAAGLLTPLEDKTPEQKEKILKGLAMHEIPLPEPKTASEKRLHDKVRADLGMTPQPKTPSAKIKYNDAVAAGFIAPLEGKSPSQKEKILKGQAALGIPLPEGRTPSEKALIAKIKATAPKPEEKRIPVHIIPSEKLRKAKEAGLLTPLEGKTPEQKEKILKELALHGIPLPEPKTASESKVIDKVVAALGMPPQPKTSSEKLKYKHAAAAGLITPLQGKSKAQKEKILRGQAQLGLALPEGRTTSEKALIAKIKAKPKLIEKISRPALPPQKLAKLDKKTAKVMKESKKPSDECICDLLTPETERGLKEAASIVKIPSKKLQKAKAAGLLTPLQGKTAKQKEKILKDLAMQGIPLPEATTSSEKKIFAKVRDDIGLPPEPKTSAMKQKYDRAIADNIIVPLEGKTKAEKEKVLRKQAALGLPLPVGRTPSEKALIAKVEKEAVPSEKLRKAKAAGLLTPLKGKTAKQKEKNLKDLAMQGMPLPEATSSSEKKLIAKVRDDIGLPPEPKTSAMKQKYDRAIADDIIVPLEGKTNAEKEKILRKQAALGLPLPAGRTPSEKALIAKVEKEAVPSEKLRKAKAAGLLTPLEGKTPQQKEKILQGLAEAGLPLPEGKTTSEIALIQKIKPKPEVAPKYIATEKEKIKTKSRKVGVPKSKGGIIEEFQDIIKTTTCDKGCGCDKKKIRFKHSYVKIRVTSPDISSLCPCPEECLPGVKGGVFTDNEGIKVTVGRVTCIPSNHSRKLNGNDNYEENYKYCSTLTRSTMFKNCTTKKKIDSKSESDISLSRRSFLYNSDDYLKKNIAFVDSYLCRYSGSSSTSIQNVISTDISVNSFNSINFLKTTSSVSLITLPSSVSVWSFSATSHSTSNCSDKESSLMKNYIDNYETIRNIFLPRQNKGNISYTSLNTNEYRFATHKEIQIYRASDVNNNVFDNKLNSAHSGSTHIIYVDEINNKNEITKLLKKTISETNNLYNSSSLFIIVSSSSDGSSDYCSSTICLDLSETHSIWNPGTSGLHHLREKQKGFKISTRGNVRDLDNNDNLLSPQLGEIAENLLNPKKYDKLLHRNNCKRIVSTDTTEDRPCCCEVNNIDSGHRDVRVQRSDRIVSEFLKPMILKDVVNQGFSHDYYMLDLPDTPKSSYYSSPHHSNRCDPTPVRLCKLPPCSGHNLCHDNEQMKKRRYAHPKDVSPPIPQFYKSCDCSTDKLIKLFEEKAKQLVSIACGDSNDDLRKGCNKMERRTVKMPYEITSEPNKCSSCTSSKSNLQPIIARDNKKYSCPCEEHQKMSHMDEYSREFDSTTSNKQNNCQCPDRPQKKKNKNIVCECPEEPELEFDISDWFDEKQLRKMQSDLTQTTSGFKIQIPRKKSDSEVSFEEALRYYAENLENIDDEKCGCKDKSKKKSNARCECQYEPPPPVEHAEPINEPFTGIKFRIDGKGTASKGLSGILCFE